MREAASSVDLMRERFARMRAEEESKKGLIVVLALYGRINIQGKQVLIRKRK